MKLHLDVSVPNPHMLEKSRQSTADLFLTVSIKVGPNQQVHGTLTIPVLGDVDVKRNVSNLLLKQNGY